MYIDCFTSRIDELSMSIVERTPGIAASTKSSCTHQVQSKLWTPHTQAVVIYNAADVGDLGWLFSV